MIARHIDVEKGNLQGTCKMCGCDTTHGFLAKDYIKDARFTNFDELQNVQSNVICEYCSACMKEPKLRRSCYIADEKQIIWLKKNDIENYVFDLANIIQGQFVVCITESFKKHTSFKAVVNQDTKRYTITHENYKFVFDVRKMEKVYAVLNEMYLYFSKDELLTGDYNAYYIMEYMKSGHTEQEFLQNESVLSTVRGSKAFEFCVYMLNSERKNEFVKEQKKCKKKK